MSRRDGTAAVAPTRDTRWRMISHTAEYALRAVLCLAEQSPAQLTSAGGLANAVNVPERYLSRVLNALVHAGLLVSTRGAHGGFRLAHDAAALTLAQVVAPFDAVGDPPQCLLRDQPCGTGELCLAHAEWHAVAGSVRAFFQDTTIADLLAAHRADLAATRNRTTHS